MLNPALTTYVLRAALGERFVLSMLVGVVIAACLSMFLGGAAVIEPTQAALSLTANAFRLLVLTCIVLFTVFFLRRAHDTQDIDYILSRPVGRVSFIFSALCGIIIICFITTLTITLLIGGFFFKIMSVPGLILWGGSFFIEAAITGCSAFFFAMVISSTVAATLATMAGYVLARLSGPVLAIIDSPNDQITSPRMNQLMEAALTIVPRLDLYAQSSWLIYGPGQISFAFMLLHGGAFILLLATLSIADLMRKEF